MEHSEVFVIGAGPAGLTSAYLLTKAGVSTRVIEMDPRYVGGISRTVNYKDFLFDIGGHRFFSKSKEVVDLWHELLPDDFIQRPRLSRIYYGGKHYGKHYGGKHGHGHRYVYRHGHGYGYWRSGIWIAAPIIAYGAYAGSYCSELYYYDYYRWLYECQ